jgi:excisionase family DNA binding protein
MSPAKGQQHYVTEAAELQNFKPDEPGGAMLSTEAAAELMQCSRPYVVMLIDNKRLAGASVTEGGDRRVPESSVRAWIKDRAAPAAGLDHHAVAEQNGMYDTPEKAFVEANKRRRT